MSALKTETKVKGARANLVARIDILQHQACQDADDRETLKDLTKELEEFDEHYATPVRTELNSAEKTARYKVKRRAIVERIEKVCNHNIHDPSVGITPGVKEEIALYKELEALDKVQEEQLKYKSNCHYPLEDKECTIWNEDVDAERNTIKKAASDMVDNINIKRDMERLEQRDTSLLTNINRGNTISSSDDEKQELNNPIADSMCEFSDSLDVMAFSYMTDEELRDDNTQEAYEECKRRKFLKVINNSESTEEDFVRALVEYGILYDESKITKILHKEFKDQIQARIKKINIGVNVTQEGLDKFKNSKVQVSPLDVGISTPREQLENIAKIVEHNITKMSPATTKTIVESLKDLARHSYNMEKIANVQIKQINTLLDCIYSAKPLSDRKEASQWENLFIKEKDKCEMLAEDNGQLREKLALHTRHGKMQWIINDAITKVHTGVNTDVIILCHTSQADKLFKQLCDRVVDRLKEVNQKDVKILEDTKQKTNIIYYTDGSCIRIVNDSGCFIMEVEK